MVGGGVYISASMYPTAGGREGGVHLREQQLSRIVGNCTDPKNGPPRWPCG